MTNSTEQAEPPTKSSQRAAARAQACLLSLASRAAASLAMTERLLAQLPPLAGWNIAAYWPVAEEIDTRPLLQRCQKQGAQVYLPAVVKAHAAGKTSMEFRLFDTEKPSAKDATGLCCPPDDSSVITLHKLHLMLLPVRAFDGSGNRLGTGGGYYDRYLAAKGDHARPFLIGLGFTEQQTTEPISPEAHDVRLDAVATPLALHLHNATLLATLVATGQ